MLNFVRNLRPTVKQTMAELVLDKFFFVFFGTLERNFLEGLKKQKIWTFLRRL